MINCFDKSYSGFIIAGKALHILGKLFEMRYLLKAPFLLNYYWIVVLIFCKEKICNEFLNDYLNEYELKTLPNKS